MSWTLDASTVTLDSNLITLDGWSGATAPNYSFTWVPSYGAIVDSEPVLREAKFGDGYSQRNGLGINNIKDQWNLSFEDRSQLEKEAIVAFLRARNMGQSFRWTPYDSDVEISVICRKWSTKAENFESYSITCIFERVYGE